MAAGFETTKLAWETQKVSAEAHRKAWKSEADAAVKEGRICPTMPAGAEEPKQPERPRIRISDVTMEKVGALAAALPRGLLLARDEIAGWVGAFDRYGGSGSDRSFYLEAFGGKSYRIDRMKTPDPINIRHLSVGICGTTQPDKLSLMTGGADDGFASRFLWTWPEETEGFSLSRTVFEDRPASFAFARLTELPLGSDEYGNPEPIKLKLDRDAEDVIEAFAREIKAVGRDAHGPYASTLGKARGHVLRLATVLEYLRWSGSRPAPEPTSIGVQAVADAAGLMSGYYLPMAERAFGDASIPTSERHAMALVRRLRASKVRAFNAREIRRHMGGALREAENMTAACAVLEEGNWIRPRQHVGMGRRPKNYEVRPLLWEAA